MQAEKKPLNLELILIIVNAVLAVLFICLIIANVIKGSSAPSPTEQKEEKAEESETSNNTEDDADADDSITTKRINQSIDEDLNTIQRMISNYQSNNRGKVPASDSEWKNFRGYYFNTDFKGKYTLKNCDNKLGNCEKPLSLTWKDNANIIYVANHASCKDSTLEYDAKSSKVAIYTHYKGETNGVSCINN